MAQIMADQRKLDVELFHNQVGYLSDPPTEHFDMFNSMIVSLNNSRITHALKTNHVICHDTLQDFWLSAKVKRTWRDAARSIKAKMLKKEVIITKAIIRKVLQFEDQPEHPTTFEPGNAITALRRMIYEEDYPMMLKKLFPP
ncbi:hypothetical protein Hanom_Chr05g00424641 [Helianthus anomalus]